VNARSRLRAEKSITWRDDDAGATPLRAESGRDKLSKDDIKLSERDATLELGQQIGRCQEMLYAQRKHKLLIILQGMDTSGKDGTVRSLFSHVNPMGLRAVQFKAPSAHEAAHDFLWRVHQQVPAWGEIAIFNRSHYEDVLVPVVQEQIDDKECQRRYAHIAAFEHMLADSGTVIVKLFLHVSKDEQRKRLQARLDDPEKQWKFDQSDLVQRERWDLYHQAYARAIEVTDTDHAPWYIIPADSKTHRNLLVSTLLLEIMNDLGLAFPEPLARLSKLRID